MAAPDPGGTRAGVGPARRRSQLGRLELLASLAEGRPLGQAFADGSVRSVAAPIADLGRLALYEPRRRTVTVAAEAAAMPPSSVATVRAHKGTHGGRYVSGRLAEGARVLGCVIACCDDEPRASLVQLRIWQTLHPPDGKPEPAYDYEDWLNVELAAVQQNPDRYPADVRGWYADLCELTPYCLAGCRLRDSRPGSETLC